MNHRPIETDSNIAMEDPVAFFITWVTYGTWLPGDQRGWVEHKRGWHLPNHLLEFESKARMTEFACRLNKQDRSIVENQLDQTCRKRNWKMQARTCRSNHVHVVVSGAETNPSIIRADLKAWCSRSLNKHSAQVRNKWWAEKGSVRWVWNQQSLENVIEYVQEGQNRKHLDSN